VTAVSATASTLDRLRAEQVGRWVSGDRPPAEDFLARHPELAADGEAAVVLVYGEVLLREELDGTLPDPAEYVARFPMHAAALARQFALHGALTVPERGPDLPGFEIVRELGGGGMGVVYLARETALGRMVAVKVLLSGPFASPGARKRFRTEAESVARLRHPHIVAVHAVGEHRPASGCPGAPYLVLEYVAGGSLDRHLNGTPLRRTAQNAASRGRPVNRRIVLATSNCLTCWPDRVTIDLARRGFLSCSAPSVKPSPECCGICP
jgi:hypothetical protein